MPWSEGKHRLTDTYAWFLAGWARRLSWKEVAVSFRTTWDHVFRSVEMAVSWGRKHRDLTAINARFTPFAGVGIHCSIVIRLGNQAGHIVLGYIGKCLTMTSTAVADKNLVDPVHLFSLKLESIPQILRYCIYKTVYLGMIVQYLPYDS